jgi:hypothetical protein
MSRSTIAYEQMWAMLRLNAPDWTPKCLLAWPSAHGMGIGADNVPDSGPLPASGIVVARQARNLLTR